MIFKSIIVFINRKCPVGCESCSAGALPGNQAELTPSHITALFEHLTHLNNSNPPPDPNSEEKKEKYHTGYIIWTGGEPFLSTQTLFKGIKNASAFGYHSEILTSGIWFKNTPQMLNTLSQFRNVSIRISLDAEHQRRVPVARIIELIRSAARVNIPINFTLREIPGQPGSAAQSLEEIKRALPEFYHENVQRTRWIHQIPHIPIERIQNSQADHFSPCENTGSQHKTYSFRRPCKMMLRDLVIGEDGYIYPCCGFFSLPHHLKKMLTLGSIIDPPPLEALSPRSTLEKYPLMCALKKKGPYGILSDLHIHIDELSTSNFENICHFCLTLFSQKADQVFSYYR